MSQIFHGRGFEFTVPEQSIERSMIFYTTPGPARDGSWPTIAVSYEKLEVGETLARFCNRQLAKLGTTVTGLAVDTMREVQLAGHTAFETMLRWNERANIAMRQRMVVSELANRQALLLSNIATEAAFEEAGPFFLTALNSFAWQPASGGR